MPTRRALVVCNLVRSVRGRARLAVAWGLVALPLAAAAAERLLVITSNDHAAFQQAQAGLRQAFPAAEILQATPDDAPAVAQTVGRLPKDGVIVTLGRRASAMVAAATPPHPVVECLAGGDAVPRSGSVLVVPQAVSLDAQAAWLKRLLPAARNVGILFDPAHNERRIGDLAAAWKRAGFVVVLEPVSGPAALPGALGRLARNVDVLYAIPDATVYAAEHSRTLLLFSFRHRIPLVGPSERWVRAGALYALEWDYADVGRYCGALAVRQLGGAKAPSPTPPRTRVVANARTADHQHVRWDADTRKTFERVYE